MTTDSAAAPVAAPVPQACTLVLPSSGAFDSRTWRIASTLAARGHHVTVMARSEAGLPDREDHPAGYRIDPGPGVGGRGTAAADPADRRAAAPVAARRAATGAAAASAVPPRTSAGPARPSVAGSAAPSTRSCGSPRSA